MARLFRSLVAVVALASPGILASANKDLTVPVDTGEVLVLGDTHGTAEIPEAARNLVNVMSRQGPLVLGLELDSDSANIPCTTEAATVPISWRRAAADGRTSRAMRDLLCYALKLEKKRKLKIVYLNSAGRGRDFDTKAAHLFQEAMRATPRGTGLVLAGNFHTRNMGAAIPPALRAAGYKVTTATASTRATNVEVWQCQPDGCGLRPTTIDFCPEATPGAGPGWQNSPDPRWDKCLTIPSLSPSLPFDSN